MIFDAENPNQHGVYNAILIAASGGGWSVEQTGISLMQTQANTLFNATNIPSGRTAMGPMGENLMYVTQSRQGTNYVVGEWNSSKLWTW